MVETKNIKIFIKDCMNYINIESFDITKSFIDNIDDNKDNSLKFTNELEKIKISLEEDVEFFLESDPAADSIEEIIITYPGYYAITCYRIAHILFNLKYNVIARMISERAHSKTGIDIHPGATIDSPFFIDHGTGIVIGETSIIGKRVKLYQGVTLGALSLSKGSKLKGIKRHPTVGNDVTIYSNASILGDITIGNNVTIGSNVFLMENVDSDMKVTIDKPILVMKSR